jgi:predicted MFS family arabinose efflux permease
VPKGCWVDNEAQKRNGHKTYALDLARSPFAGILESTFHTLILLIAIRVYDPNPIFKAIIPASISLGLLLSPVVLSLTAKVPVRATRWASMFWGGTAVLLLIASTTNTFATYFAAITPAMFCYAMIPTFMIFAYAKNYTANQRGQRIAVFFVVSSIAAAFFGFGAGKWLDASLEHFQWILFGAALGAGMSSVCGFFMPSEVIEPRHSASLKDNISLIWKDKLFGGMLASWMFIGFANLPMIPLRVEYLASDKYGVDFTNEDITTILIIIPSVCRILSTRIWGYLFDRVNLLTLRSVLNSMFLVSIFAFFHTTSFTTMAVAMAIMGLAHGGGNIAWSLWVTKIAPPEKTAAYMSIHTASTGVRGLLSPFLGFAAISFFGPATTSLIACSLAFISILMHIPMIKDPRLSAKKVPVG